MTELVDIPTTSSFFSPKNLVGAAALLVEPTEHNPDVMTDNGRKNQVIADVTVFLSLEDIEAGNAEVLTNQKIEQTVLARDLAGLVGAKTVVTLKQLAGRNGNQGAWVFNQADATTKKAVIGYLTARDAAEAEDMPDYLK